VQSSRTKAVCSCTDDDTRTKHLKLKVIDSNVTFPQSFVKSLVCKIIDAVYLLFTELVYGVEFSDPVSHHCPSG